MNKTIDGLHMNEIHKSYSLQCTRNISAKIPWKVWTITS